MHSSNKKLPWGFKGLGLNGVQDTIGHHSTLCTIRKNSEMSLRKLGQ